MASSSICAPLIRLVTAPDFKILPPNAPNLLTPTVHANVQCTVGLNFSTPMTCIANSKSYCTSPLLVYMNAFLTKSDGRTLVAVRMTHVSSCALCTTVPQRFRSPRNLSCVPKHVLPINPFDFRYRSAEPAQKPFGEQVVPSLPVGSGLPGNYHKLGYRRLSRSPAISSKLTPIDGDRVHASNAGLMIGHKQHFAKVKR